MISISAFCCLGNVTNSSSRAFKVKPYITAVAVPIHLSDIWHSFCSILFSVSLCFFSTDALEIQTYNSFSAYLKYMLLYVKDSVLLICWSHRLTGSKNSMAIHHKVDPLIPPGFPCFFSMLKLGAVHVFAHVSLVGVRGEWCMRQEEQ